MINSKWTLRILIILLICSLYYNYHQNKKIDNLTMDFKRHQTNMFHDANWQIQEIVQNGYKILATNDEEKTRNYFQEIRRIQRTLNSYVLMYSISHYQGEFYNNKHILQVLMSSMNELLTGMEKQGLSEENIHQLLIYLEDYATIGEYYDAIYKQAYAKGSEEQIKLSLQELNSLFGEKYSRYGNAPRYEDLTEEEIQRNQEEFLRQEREMEAFGPTAIEIARNFLGDEIANYQELGIIGSGYSSAQAPYLSVGFKNAGIETVIGVNVLGDIISFRESYSTGKRPVVDKISLNKREAIEAAVGFLSNKVHITKVFLFEEGDMNVEEGYLSLHFKEVAKDVVIGATQINVVVSLGDGTINEFFQSVNKDEPIESIKDKIVEPPSITSKEAEALIGKHNQIIDDGVLFYRYDEILTWRFKINTLGYSQVIYIDAHTGEEVEISKL